MKQPFAGKHFNAVDNLFLGVWALLGGLSADFLQTVFQEWIRPLQLCREGGGEYFE
jgi:hypothetical protein